MRRLLLLALLAMPASAAEIEAGIRHVAAGMMGDGRFDGGDLHIPHTRGWAMTGEVFWSDRLSTHAASTFINPAVFLRPSDPGRPEIDLDTVGINTWSLTARWNFGSRWAPFAGAGAAYALFGTLDDRFGDDLEFELENQLTFVAEAGLRYRILPSVSLDVGAAYMPLDPETRIVHSEDPALRLPEEIELDPLLITGGVSWRF